MSCHLCPCHLEWPVDTAGYKRDPINCEKAWLDFAVRLLSREAVGKGRGQETVWSARCKPQWWDTTVGHPWKNPTANPKDTKEILLEKYTALESRLRAEYRFPKELEEESCLWREGRYKELFLLTSLISLLGKVSHVHSAVGDAFHKVKELNAEVNQSILANIQNCLTASLTKTEELKRKTSTKNKDDNFKTNTKKRGIDTVGKENTGCSPTKQQKVEVTHPSHNVLPTPLISGSFKANSDKKPSDILAFAQKLLAKRKSHKTATPVKAHKQILPKPTIPVPLYVPTSNANCAPIHISGTPSPVQISSAPSPVQISSSPSPVQISSPPLSVHNFSTPSPFQISSSSSPVQISSSPSPVQNFSTPSPVQISSFPSPVQISSPPTPLQNSCTPSLVQISSPPTPLQNSSTPSPVQISLSPEQLEWLLSQTSVQVAPLPAADVSPSIECRPPLSESQVSYVSPVPEYNTATTPDPEILSIVLNVTQLHSATHTTLPHISMQHAETPASDTVGLSRTETSDSTKTESIDELLLEEFCDEILNGSNQTADQISLSQENVFTFDDSQANNILGLTSDPFMEPSNSDEEAISSSLRVTNGRVGSTESSCPSGVGNTCGSDIGYFSEGSPSSGSGSSQADLEPSSLWEEDGAFLIHKFLFD